MYSNLETVIYHNGEFINPSKATNSIYSQTLHYGNGVFEGMRAYPTNNGTSVFKIKEHYERLLFGVKVMGITFDYSIEEMIKLTYEVLKKNQLTDAYIRPIVSLEPNMSLTTPVKSNFTILAWKWGKLLGDKLLRIKISPFQRPNPKSCFVEAKVTGHYVNSILASNDALNTGYDEALLLDMNGNIAEGPGANIFIEKNGKLYTPSRGNILAGITRNTVIDLCKENNINVEEKQITLNELKQADSAFYTGTAAEVVGIKSIDKYEFPLKWSYSLGNKLLKLYKNEVLGK